VTDDTGGLAPLPAGAFFAAAKKTFFMSAILLKRGVYIC